MATAAPLHAILSVSASSQSSSIRTLPATRPRRISPETGRGLEMLGHAIEYLADEFALECRARGGATAGKHGQVQAIELLMAHNRKLYLSCPLVPTLAERLRCLVRLQRA